MPQPDHHSDTLNRMTNAINQAGLRVPVRIALEIVQPLDFVSSQLFLFVHPFAVGSRFEPYTTALTDEASWQELRLLLK